RLRTPAETAYEVRTQVLAPGAALGWETHPGTEITLVEAGEVTVQEFGACAPRPVPAGRTVVVGEGVPHVVVNTGPEPARLVVTTLLTPGPPATAPVPPAC
uniref:cupin domain-containing protein n=1 Tax=Pseudonocardia pini TaxID=2758030 RepID=UPI0015F0896A